jgi:hypothetical protein
MIADFGLRIADSEPIRLSVSGLPLGRGGFPVLMEEGPSQ